MWFRHLVLTGSLQAPSGGRPSASPCRTAGALGLGTQNCRIRSSQGPGNQSGRLPFKYSPSTSPEERLHLQDTAAPHLQTGPRAATAGWLSGLGSHCMAHTQPAPRPMRAQQLSGSCSLSNGYRSCLGQVDRLPLQTDT